MNEKLQEAKMTVLSSVQASQKDGPVTAELLSSSILRTAIIGMFVLAVFYTLYFIAEFMIPVVAAILLNFILSPVTRFLHRFHIPLPVSAGLIVIMLLAGCTGIFYSLSGSASSWMERVPEIAGELEDSIETIRKPIEEVQKATDKVEQIASIEIAGKPKNEVIVKSPGFLQRFFGSISGFSVQLVFVLSLLYFLLAVGDLFKRNLINVMPRLKDKLRAEQIVLQVEQDISKYLLTITVINVCLGLTIGGALYLLGFPNALQWGIVTGLLNYIPYLGGLIGVVGIMVVGLITFDNVADAMIAPMIYVVINTIESQIITPSILSQRLMLNPIIVFFTVSFWAWLWGIPGALMAVPLLVIFKTFCDQIESMRSLGEFIGINAIRPMIIMTRFQKQ